MAPAFKNILLADDDREDVEIIQSAFEEICPDIAVNVAENGLEVFSLLEQMQQPDLIVLDINMPIKSGKQCLFEIRSIEKYDAIPVIILSTSSYRQDIDFCMANGANRYYTKPGNFRDVKKFVAEICEGTL